MSEIINVAKQLKDMHLKDVLEKVLSMCTSVEASTNVAENI